MVGAGHGMIRELPRYIYKRPLSGLPVDREIGLLLTLVPREKKVPRFADPITVNVLSMGLPEIELPVRRGLANC